MRTYEGIRPGPAVPAAFADIGYWTKEYDTHTVTVGFKDEEIAAFSAVAVTPDAILDIIVRHFIGIVLFWLVEGNEKD